jgi:heterodisulfide reductase subunit A2
MSSSDTEIRKGVYICRCGGNISDVVDCEKVAAQAADMPGVVVSRVETFMCSDPSQGGIIEDIEKHNLNRIVIASCSPSLHELTFRNTAIRAGLNPYLYEHVNIREQVSWVHCTAAELATEKATRLVEAAVNKTEYMEPLTPIDVEVTQRSLVIGGGIAGIRAAIDFSARGLKVTLVEKSPFLGGRMAQLGNLFPTDDNARELLSRLIEQMLDDPNIEILVSADIKRVDGYVGNFDVDIEVAPRYVRPGLSAERIEKAINDCPVAVTDEFNYGLTERKAIFSSFEGGYPSLPAIDMEKFASCDKCRELLGEDVVDCDQQPQQFTAKVGAIVLATGFDPYEPYTGEFGYGEFPEVITLPQLMRLLDPQGPSGGKLSIDDRPINSVAFIHCVGSRQIDGIHQPAADGTLNTYCSRVCCTATLQAATEIREKFPAVTVYDFYKDIRTYGKYHEEYYERASKERVVFIKYNDEGLPVVEKDTSGEAALTVRAKDMLTWQEEVSVPVDLVVLATGMEPRKIDNLVNLMKLPVGADRFLREVHPKLSPVELATNGLFLAGTVQAPMNIDEAAGAASATVVKASKILTRDKIELDPFIAVVDPEKCDGTGLCVAECEYTGAINIVEKVIDGETVRRAEISEALCKGCGSCVAVCPSAAINVAGSTLQQLYAMVDGFIGL